MSRTITLTDCRVAKIEIDKRYPEGGTPYLQVSVRYEILDDSPTPEPITSKALTRFSSESGLPAGDILPAAWETTFESLVADVEAKLDDVESL